MPSFRGKQCEVTQANYQTEAVVMTSGPLFLRLGVPNGMEELLEGLAREVLRHQPKNIYKFAAIHFEGLLLQREAAQTAALSGVTTAKAEEAAVQEKPAAVHAEIQEVPPVRPPRSPTTDSGKASATSSPANSPAQAQVVKARLTTAGEKLPSPILQQAITKAFSDEESAKTPVSSGSPIQSGATSSEDKILGSDVVESPVSSESKSEKRSFGFSNIKSFGSPVKDLLSDGSKSISSGLSSAVSKAEQLESSATKSVESAKSEAESRIGSAKSEVESTVSEAKSQVESAATEAKEGAQKIISEAEAKAEEIKSDVEHQAAEAEEKALSELDRTISAAESKMIEIKEEAASAVDDAEKIATETLAAAESKITEVKEEAESKVEAAKDEVDRAVSAAQSQLESIQSEISSKVEEAKDKADEAKAEVGAKIEEVKAEAANAVSAVESQVESIKSEAENKISETQSQIEEIQSEVTNKVAEAEKEIEEVKSEAQNLIAEAEAKVDESLAEAESKVAAVASEVEEKIVVVESTVESAVEGAEKQIIEIKSEVEKQVDETTAAAEEKITEALEEKAAEATEKLAEIQSDIEGQVEEVQASVENKISEVNSDIETAATEAENKLNEQFEEVKGDLNEKVSVIENEFTSVISSAQDFAQETESQATEIEKSIADVQEAAVETVSKAKVSFESSVTEIKDEVESKQEAASELLADAQDLIEEEQAEISSAAEVADLAAAKAASLIEERVAAVAAAKEEKEEEIADELEKVQKSALEVIENVIAEAESKLESAVAEVEVAATETEARVEEAVAKVQAAEEQVQETLETVTEEIATAVPDASASVVEVLTESEQAAQNELLEEAERALSSLHSTAESEKEEIVGAVDEIISEAQHAAEEILERTSSALSGGVTDDQIAEELASTLAKEAEQVVSTQSPAAVHSPEQPSTCDEISTANLLDEEPSADKEGPVVVSPASVENEAVDAEHDPLEPEAVESPKPASLLIPIATTIDVTPATPIPSPSKEEQGIFDNVKFDADALIENTQNALNNNEDVVAIAADEDGEKGILIESAAALVRHEDEEEASESQSSAPIGNEGLGAVSSVVIRYSISEGVNGGAQGEEEDAGETEGKKAEESLVQEDKEIADTLISAVRNSDESSPTEEASEGPATLSEPADLISGQTASSKDAPSLELDDLKKSAVVVEPIDLSALKESPEIAQEGLQKILEESSVDISSSAAESKGQEDLEVAATKIQASFRGYKTRKALSDKPEEKDLMPLIEENAIFNNETPKEHDFESHVALSQPSARATTPDSPSSEGTLSDVRPHFSDASPTPDGPAALSPAASTHAVASPVAIPRGRQLSFSSGECGDVSGSLTEPLASEEEAATKIQAHFRGHRVRQSVLRRREDAMVADAPAGGDLRHSGEFHDSLVLPPALGTGLLLAAAGRPPTPSRDEALVGPEMDFLDKAATRIQATFRGFRARADLKKKSGEPASKQDHDAAAKIQAGFRGYKVRKEMKERLQQQTPVATPEEQRSAVKIQAGVRGYLTRQQLKRDKVQPSEPSPEQINDAVLKIQSGFRGYKARQEVKSMRNANK